jgi:hypothetical protein
MQRRETGREREREKEYIYITTKEELCLEIKNSIFIFTSQRDIKNRPSTDQQQVNNQSTTGATAF